MKAEITVDANGHGKVVIDGTDVASLLQRFSVHAREGRMTELDLGVMIPQNLHFEGDVEITLPEDLVTILLRMGWKQPAVSS